MRASFVMNKKFKRREKELVNALNIVAQQYELCLKMEHNTKELNALENHIRILKDELELCRRYMEE